jgi:histidine phosphotransfer protein HptB
MPDDVIDRRVFAELQSTAGEEFVAELIGTFLEEAPRMLAELRDAAGQGHADRYRRAAHSLKSNALTFGATQLAAQARALEHSSLSGDRAQNTSALAALETAYAAAAASLTTLKG